MKIPVYPQYVNVLTSDGQIEKVKYVDVFEYENNTIFNNIWFGIKSGYSEEKIEKCQKEAEQQFNKLKKAIWENHDVLLILSKRTRHYVIYKNQKEN